MIGDKAGGMGSTHSRTGIHTVLVDTGQVAGALLVTHTLRLTLHVRVTNVVPDTFTAGRLVALCTLGIDAAGRRITRLYNLDGSLCCRGGVAD